MSRFKSQSDISRLTGPGCKCFCNNLVVTDVFDVLGLPLYIEHLLSSFFGFFSLDFSR